MATAGMTVPAHFVRLTSALREDLAVWAKFLDCFNGRSLFQEGPLSNRDLELYTDASGSYGFGAYFQGEWSAVWRKKGFCGNLALLELLS